MKKVIAGGFLLISGVIGLCLWTIANALTVELGARSDVFGGYDSVHEWIILIAFAIMIIAGLVICLKNAWSKSDSISITDEKP